MRATLGTMVCGRSREEEQEEMDTPGIEPGAFRLQSGRATTALCAQQISTLPHQFTLPRTAPYHSFSSSSSSSQNLRQTGPSHIATPLTNRCNTSHTCLHCSLLGYTPRRYEASSSLLIHPPDRLMTSTWRLAVISRSEKRLGRTTLRFALPRVGDDDEHEYLPKPVYMENRRDRATHGPERSRTR